jgi:hypothetical protein
MVVYALVVIVGLVAYLAAHKTFLRSFDWIILSVGTLIGTTCISVTVYYWLRMTGGGSTIRLFVGLFTGVFGGIASFLTFSYVLGHAARRKAISEGRSLFFPILTSIVLSILAAPVLNVVFMVITSFTTLPLLQILRPLLVPFEKMIFN